MSRYLLDTHVWLWMQAEPDRMRRSGTSPLPVEHAHVLRTGSLPDHHQDPFDRVLVAQAQLLDIPIITVDDRITAYDVRCVAA